MAKLQSSVFLRSSLGNSKGQSAVEYILLIAVIASISIAVLKNKKFTAFMNGNTGLFVTLKQGMEYSYRYGRELKDDVDFDEAMNFKYQTNKHDTFYNPKENKSRFFSGQDPYGE